VVTVAMVGARQAVLLAPPPMQPLGIEPGLS
jgi:hypothetical protein